MTIDPFWTPTDETARGLEGPCSSDDRIAFGLALAPFVDASLRDSDRLPRILDGHEVGRVFVDDGLLGDRIVLDDGPPLDTNR